MKRLRFVLYAISAFLFLASAFEAGRWSVVQSWCPFELEKMEISPQTPIAYHHIGHHAPKHGVAVPLPPRRPVGI